MSTCDKLIPYSSLFIDDVLDGHVNVPEDVFDLVEELTEHESDWSHVLVGALIEQEEQDDDELSVDNEKLADLIHDGCDGHDTLAFIEDLLDLLEVYRPEEYKKYVDDYKDELQLLQEEDED